MVGCPGLEGRKEVSGDTSHSVNRWESSGTQLQGKELRWRGRWTQCCQSRGQGRVGMGNQHLREMAALVSAQPSRRDAHNMPIYRLLNSPRSSSISSQPCWLWKIVCWWAEIIVTVKGWWLPACSLESMKSAGASLNHLDSGRQICPLEEKTDPASWNLN